MHGHGEPLLSTSPTTRRPRAWVELTRREPQVVIVAGAALVWSVVMYLAVWRRHDRYGTYDLDTGFHAQYVWQLARGRSFSTILGLPAFGHNATFGYFLLVPLSWLGLDGPQAFSLIQTAVVASATIPIYVLARRRLGPGWPAAGMALAWLLHPVVQHVVWETFHPEVMAATALLWAYVLADARRWRPFLVAVLLAIVWKTDVSLFVVMLGLWVARRDRRVGLGTAAFAAIWFVVVIELVIPRVSGGGTVFGGLYGDLGDTPGDVIVNSVRHPDRFGQHVADARAGRYGRDLLAPYAFAPVLAPAQLALALPQYAVNVLSDDTSPREWTWAPHYQALPLVALTLGLVEGVGWVHRRRPKAVGPICSAVLACGMATSVAWGSLPMGVRSATYWSADGDPLRPAKDAAVALVPDGAGVSSSYLLTAHLAQREVVYTFPNPWRMWLYGVEGTERADPAEVDWIVLDEGIMSPEDKALQACIMAFGSFEEAMRDRDIVVLRRLPGTEPRDVTCT